MKTLTMLLLFCHTASAVERSLRFYFVVSSGVPNIPDYMAMADIEEVIIGYYDSSLETVEPRQDWVRKLIKEEPQLWERLNEDNSDRQPLLKARSDSFKQQLNQSGGVQITQEIIECDWDDETEKVHLYNLYGYNGENFLTFDGETKSWIAEKPQAEIIKQQWNGNIVNIEFWTRYLNTKCVAWLKMSLNYGKNLLQRKDLPSVSLLQKSPSSPVSCHATGFFPNRAVMFWRKDGEEIHEDVDLGEILPNHDGSFQMSIDLNVSSVTPEDWRRYDCVFHLSGVKDDIVTKLDKALIRTNWETPRDMTVPITAAMVALILIVVTGIIVYKKKSCLTGFPLI